MSARTPDVIVRELIARLDDVERHITELEQWEAMLLPEGVDGVSVSFREPLSNLMTVATLFLAKCEKELGLQAGILRTDSRSALHHLSQTRPAG